MLCGAASDLLPQNVGRASQLLTARIVHSCIDDPVDKALVGVCFEAWAASIEQWRQEDALVVIAKLESETRQLRQELSDENRSCARHKIVATNASSTASRSKFLAESRIEEFTEFEERLRNEVLHEQTAYRALRTEFDFESGILGNERLHWVEAKHHHREVQALQRSRDDADETVKHLSLELVQESLTHEAVQRQQRDEQWQRCSELRSQVQRLENTTLHFESKSHRLESLLLAEQEAWFETSVRDAGRGATSDAVQDSALGDSRSEHRVSCWAPKLATAEASSVQNVLPVPRGSGVVEGGIGRIAFGSLLRRSTEASLSSVFGGSATPPNGCGTPRNEGFTSPKSANSLAGHATGPRARQSGCAIGFGIGSSGGTSFPGQAFGDHVFVSDTLPPPRLLPRPMLSPSPFEGAAVALRASTFGSQYRGTSGSNSPRERRQ